jgi:hypothetical protein
LTPNEFEVLDIATRPPSFAVDNAVKLPRATDAPKNSRRRMGLLFSYLISLSFSV